MRAKNSRTVASPIKCDRIGLYEISSAASSLICGWLADEERRLNCKIVLDINDGSIRPRSAESGISKGFLHFLFIAAAVLLALRYNVAPPLCVPSTAPQHALVRPGVTTADTYPVGNV